MGDILGVGFLLALASFAIALAAAETGSPYAQLGSSRSKTFGAITEPVVLFVVFTVALITGTDLPYALAATVRSGAGQLVRPAHVLAAPWGLASTGSPTAVGLAILAFLAKAAGIGIIIAIIDDSFAKLRLFKISEFVAAAFLLAVLGVFTLYL